MSSDKIIGNISMTDVKVTIANKKKKKKGGTCVGGREYVCVRVCVCVVMVVRAEITFNLCSL